MGFRSTAKFLEILKIPSASFSKVEKLDGKVVRLNGGSKVSGSETLGKPYSNLATKNESSGLHAGQLSIYTLYSWGLSSQAEQGISFHPVDY